MRLSRRQSGAGRNRKRRNDGNRHTLIERALCKMIPTVGTLEGRMRWQGLACCAVTCLLSRRGCRIIQLAAR
jgi:hypothetical protein